MTCHIVIQNHAICGGLSMFHLVKWAFGVNHGEAGCSSEAHTRDPAASPSGHAERSYKTGYHTAMTMHGWVTPL